MESIKDQLLKVAMESVDMLKCEEKIQHLYNPIEYRLISELYNKYELLYCLESFIERFSNLQDKIIDEILVSENKEVA